MSGVLLMGVCRAVDNIDLQGRRSIRLFRNRTFSIASDHYIPLGTIQKVRTPGGGEGVPKIRTKTNDFGGGGGGGVS